MDVRQWGGGFGHVSEEAGWYEFSEERRVVALGVVGAGVIGLPEGDEVVVGGGAGRDAGAEPEV